EFKFAKSADVDELDGFYGWSGLFLYGAKGSVLDFIAQVLEKSGKSTVAVGRIVGHYLDVEAATERLGARLPSLALCVDNCVVFARSRGEAQPAEVALDARQTRTKKEKRAGCEDRAQGFLERQISADDLLKLMSAEQKRVFIRGQPIEMDQKERGVVRAGLG